MCMNEFQESRIGFGFLGGLSVDLDDDLLQV